MSEAPALSPALLLTLTGVTGIVDAVSFLALGHVFTANMTGNTVLLGFAFAGSTGVSISRSLAALVAFMLGAIVGGRMSLAPASKNWVGRALVLEASLFAISAALAMAVPTQTYPVIVSTAVAMGLRNTMVRNLGVPDLTTTVLTLTITGLAAESRLAGGSSPRWQRRLAAILAMISGASAGVVLVCRSTALPLAVCGIITAGCAVRHFQGTSIRRQASTS